MSLWDAITSEYSGGNHRCADETVSCRRIVIAGTYFVGKRTLAAKFREVLSHEHRADNSPGGRLSVVGLRSLDDGGLPTSGGVISTCVSRCGAGLDYAFVEVRSSDTDTPATQVEIVCCDSPSLMSVALPSKDALSSTAVLLLLDMSEPETLLGTLERWKAAINGRVAQLVGANTGKSPLTTALNSRRELQQSWWKAQSELMASVRMRNASGSKDVQGTEDPTESSSSQAPNPNNTIIFDGDEPLLLPGFFIAAKMDQFTEFCKQSKLEFPKQSKQLSVSQFTLEWLRMEAVCSRCGFAAANMLSKQGSEIATLLCYWCVHVLGVNFTIGLQGKDEDETDSSDEECDNSAAVSIPSTLENAANFDFGEGCFLPPGADYYDQFSPKIQHRRGGELFEEMFVGANSPHQKQVELESHESMLRTLLNVQMSQQGNRAVDAQGNASMAESEFGSVTEMFWGRKST